MRELSYLYLPWKWLTLLDMLRRKKKKSIARREQRIRCAKDNMVRLKYEGKLRLRWDELTELSRQGCGIGPGTDWRDSGKKRGDLGICRFRRFSLHNDVWVGPSFHRNLHFIWKDVFEFIWNMILTFRLN